MVELRCGRVVQMRTPGSVVQTLPHVGGERLVDERRRDAEFPVVIEPLGRGTAEGERERRDIRYRETQAKQLRQEFAVRAKQAGKRL